MSHFDLKSFYEINFSLMHQHKYSITEIENMYPYERDIYLHLLKVHIDKLNENSR